MNRTVSGRWVLALFFVCIATWSLIIALLVGVLR